MCAICDSKVVDRECERAFLLLSHFYFGRSLECNGLVDGHSAPVPLLGRIERVAFLERVLTAALVSVISIYRSSFVFEIAYTF